MAPRTNDADLGLLFSRVVRVDVGIPGQVGRSWEGLRVAFEVTRSDGATPNSCKLQIYGLAADSSAQFEAKGADVRLLAGYQFPGQIFSGSVDRVQRKQVGVDWVTEVEATDGATAYRGAWVSKTWAAETTTDQILTELAALAGLPFGYVSPLPNVTIATPLTLVGPLRDALSTLAETVGADWSIQDGELQFLVPTGASPEVAVVLSPSTGLVGSPTQTESGAEVLALLQPTIYPGRRFVLDSQHLQGTYRAKEVKHMGDSGWALPFYTSIVAVPVEG